MQYLPADILLRTPGVGDVFSRADNFSMRVWLKTDKMAQLGLTVNDVQSAINEQNLQVAAGSVGIPPQTSSEAFEFTVLTNSRLTTEEQFGNIVVRSNPAQNSIVYLKDIARIQLGKVSYQANSFVDASAPHTCWCTRRRAAMRWRRPMGYTRPWRTRRNIFPLTSITKFPSSRCRW